MSLWDKVQGVAFDASTLGSGQVVNTSLIPQEPRIEVPSQEIIRSSDLQMFDLDAPDPRGYGVPHDYWRVGQWQTVEFVRDTDEEEIAIAEKPTGGGKSAVAKALASGELFKQALNPRAIVLTRNKSLQDQYGGLYDAHLMKGKSNYKCAHEDAKHWRMADECLWTDRGMYKCPFAGDCTYLRAKRLAITRPFVCANYAYWLSAFQLSNDVRINDRFSSLVCDEAHKLSDITLDWSGTTINQYDKDEYQLRPFPIIKGTQLKTTTMDQLFGGVVDRKSPLDEVHEWLMLAAGNVDARLKTLRRLAPFTNEDDRKEARQVERFLNKLIRTIQAMEHSEADWYVRSGPGVVYHRNKRISGLVIKPLTARYQFERLFGGADRLLLMSATIGNPETFTEELGIADNRYVFRAVPNPFPASTRPVRILDAPELNKDSKEKDYQWQADSITDAIKSVDPSWCGIIHIRKKNEAPKLANRLAHRGLGDRVWVPPLQKGRQWLNTTQQLNEWECRKKQVPNSIMLSWQFWEGFDGQDEKICIVAKTPFPFLGDDYEKARMRYSGAFYRQRTAWDLVQALGRTRRGRLEDYDLDGEVRGLVAIADGNHTRVRKYMPVEVKEALVK